MTQPQSTNWILEPLNTAVVYVAEETKLGGLLQRALTHIEIGRPLLIIAAERLIGAGNTDTIEPLKRLLNAAPSQEHWAAELRANDFALLNAHSLVTIWGALEICIEDIVIKILANDSTTIAKVVAAGVRVDRAKILPNSDDYLRSLYRKIEDFVRIKNNVVQTYERVLNLFGLSAVCPQYADTLLMANALRNAIVHRGGVIDDKSIKQAPALAAHLGRTYVVTKSEYLKFHEAISAWILALMQSAIASPYCVTQNNS